VLQDTLQVSLAKQKSHEELEAKQNVEIVKEHLMAEEIEKLVEKTADISQPVNVIEEEEELAEDGYELKRREKGKQRGELTVNDPPPSSSTTSSSSFNLSATQKLLVQTQDWIKFNELSRYLQEIMQESFPKMVDDHAIQQERENLRLDISSQINNASSQVDSSVRNYMPGHIPSANSLRDQEYPHDDAHPERENNSYATDDEELPTEKVSQELMEEMS
ncbi:hypothetical protein Tco_1557161, partial [Tanacetum coccineum]